MKTEMQLGYNYQPPQGDQAYIGSLAELGGIFHIAENGIGIAYKELLPGIAHLLAVCMGNIVHSLGPVSLETFRDAQGVRNLIVDTIPGGSELSVFTLLQNPGLVACQVIGPELRAARRAGTDLSISESNDAKALLNALGPHSLGIEDGSAFNEIVQAAERIYIALRSNI